jgi:hypothetical protein
VAFRYFRQRKTYLSIIENIDFENVARLLSQDEVRQLVGRPSEVQALGRSRGVVWSYRYENYLCQWFQVELTLEQQVRSTGYGQPPECMGRDDILVPLR